jgi:hypothetical protein
MNRRGAGIDLSAYGRGFVEVLRHPSILAMPLLAAVVDMAFSYWGGLVTDPLGGAGQGLIAMVVQIVYLFAFGIAVIQAKDILRGYRGSFDEAWEEGRKKSGSILLAAIGFQFIVWVAAYIGQVLQVPVLGLILQLVAYFFLILTIPAAAIGGASGGMAISASIRAVRANVARCLVLAIVFAVLWVGVPELLVIYGYGLGAFGFDLALAGLRALVLAYLAFPFAAVFDGVGLRLW